MMLTEQLIPNDAITILPDGQIQVREAIVIFRDGVRDENFPPRYHRYVLSPGDEVAEKHESIAAVASLKWTKDVTDAWAAKVTATAEALPTERTK